jgi:hypothetical protein
MKDGAKPDQTQFGTKSGAFLNLTPCWRRLMYFFTGFFKISAGFGPNSGYSWCRVVRTLLKTLIIKDNPLLTLTTSSWFPGFLAASKCNLSIRKEVFQKNLWDPKKLVVFHKEMPLKKFHFSKFACIFTKANNVCTKVFISKLVVIFGTHNAKKILYILIHSLRSCWSFPFSILL